MAFTVVFDVPSKNLSFKLVYEPCPMWVQFDEWLPIDSSRMPNYELGYFGRLLDYISKKDIFIHPDEASCMVLVHDMHSSYGDFSELEMLVEDIKKEGYTVQIASFPQYKR